MTKRAGDGRSERRVKVVPFLSRLESDRLKNLAKLKNLAHKLLPQFPGAKWGETIWTVISGPLLRKAGRNVRRLTIAFTGPPPLEAVELEGEFAELAKALVVLRYHRRGQSAENQRSFVHAIAYVQDAAAGVSLYRVNREILDRACERIAKDYPEGTAYNLHKAVGEFAGHLDANALCVSVLDYKYVRQKRPDNADGVDIRRLDDPDVMSPSSDKMAPPGLYRLIGALYQNVPPDHRHRHHVLALTLLACMGRRFAEIATLPTTCLKPAKDGSVAVRYFRRKQSTGNVVSPQEDCWLPTATVEIVVSAIEELRTFFSASRLVAARMRATGGPDMSLLEGIASDQMFCRKDLPKLGIPDGAMQWFVKSGLVVRRRLPGIGGQASVWTDRVGLEAYLRRDFYDELVQPVQIDPSGKHYYLEDMLFCPYLYLGGSAGERRASWLATGYSHVMLDKFIERSLQALASEFASAEAMEIDFSSHAFRHTINTLLDEGGLVELLQTEWFGRKHPRDTKAYQHSSRERRVLEVREALKGGNAKGKLAQQLKKIPIALQEAFLAARVNAVHDVGPGACVHDFSQMPCDRHLQCTAECDEFVWAPKDEGRLPEVKRQWAMAMVAKRTASDRLAGDRPRQSASWLTHHDKKLGVLETILRKNGVEPFDPVAYLEGEPG